MNKAEKVRSKIIILYILKSLPGITVPELTSIAIDTCYMNYFTFATAFDDLCDNAFVVKSYRKNEVEKTSDNKPILRCDATPKGIEVLNRLNHIIPEHIHTFLNTLSKDWNTKIKKESHIIASYDPDLFGSYTVTLKLNDGIKETLLISICVPTKEMAEKICHNWENDTNSKYLNILSLLTS